MLRRRGRFDEAVAWYESLPEISIAGLVFHAPVHLRRAEIADARGRTADAAEHYARFIELWKHADPELQGTVAVARQRLAELRGSPSASHAEETRVRHPQDRARTP